jgi:hypothetical protein
MAGYSKYKERLVSHRSVLGIDGECLGHGYSVLPAFLPFIYKIDTEAGLSAGWVTTAVMSLHGTKSWIFQAGYDGKPSLSLLRRQEFRRQIHCGQTWARWCNVHNLPNYWIRL